MVMAGKPTTKWASGKKPKKKYEVVKVESPDDDPKNANWMHNEPKKRD